jgi:hypothetical protein
MQSILLPDALIKASWNYSDDDTEEDDLKGEGEEELLLDAQEAIYMISKLPTPTLLLSEMEVLLNEHSTATAEHALLIAAPPMQGIHSSGKKTRHARKVFCEQNCNSRTRLHSNPPGEIIGTTERW